MSASIAPTKAAKVHYPAGHGWTPAGRFGPQRCKVLLARYPCPYPREEHDPTLPIEDVDFSGRRRKHTEVSEWRDAQ